MNEKFKRLSQAQKQAREWRKFLSAYSQDTQVPSPAGEHKATEQFQLSTEAPVHELKDLRRSVTCIPKTAAIPVFPPEMHYLAEEWHKRPGGKLSKNVPRRIEQLADRIINDFYERRDD